MKSSQCLVSPDLRPISMDQIPIFDGSLADPSISLTCGQFLAIIEDFGGKENLSEDQMKILCHSKLSKSALALIQDHPDLTWLEQTQFLLQKFSVKLTVLEKVEVRRNLQQQKDETIEDFYKRCIQAQYLVSDDVRDVAFDREVLLHFLIGLTPFIRDLVLTTECSYSSIDSFIQEAKKHCNAIKKEPIEPEIKLEIDEKVKESKELNELFDLDESYGFESEFDEQTEESFNGWKIGFVIIVPKHLTQVES